MPNILGILHSAENTIRLVDDSVTDETLNLFIFAETSAEVKIYSRNKPKISSMRNYRRRKVFRKGLSVIETNRFSNRYVVIDDKFLYILSRPLAKMSGRGFSFIRIMGYDEVQMMLFNMKLCENRSMRNIRGNAYSCGIGRYKIKVE
ncbi:hypothetical protein IJ798_01975 [Candidatus Saccharibacteria bacterium]|nr:hypothetical protein [Candidatus Saccharibacteria bacterium]